MSKHFRIWLRMGAMSLSAQLSYGLGSVGFLLGKLIRLLFFFAFMVAIFRHAPSVAGYGLEETLLFFLTYNLVDIVTQIFFRGIYGARRAVQEGDLDYYLIQPCSPLLRMAASTVDFLDVTTVMPVIVLLAMNWQRLPVPIGPGQAAAYAFLVLNGIAIALAIHIVVAALAVRTQELENTIWLYRELMFLGRFPIDVYSAAMRWALVLFIPIGVMTSFPTKALLGTLETGPMLYAFGLSAFAMALSLKFWRGALAQYTSVSS